MSNGVTNSHINLPEENFYKTNADLRRFSKLTCFSTLFLIFVGGLVTSTGSGLSVPDWPLSYGTLFPPMVGGVRYEHTHRIVAGTVGFFMLVLAIWLAKVEKRCWVKNLGFIALGTVIMQGVLGGITVLFFLPKPISILHAVLAQTFFVLTIIIAYSQSIERNERTTQQHIPHSSFLSKTCLALTILVYLQLILGAVMRHTGSGLAIPDFPTTGGQLIPRFNDEMLKVINDWRFNLNLDPVTLNQVLIHSAHRMGALVIVIAVSFLTLKAFPLKYNDKRILQSVFILDALVVIQIALGIITVLSRKAVYITTLHVLTGTAVLGMSILLTLRAYPLTLKEIRP